MGGTGGSSSAAPPSPQPAEPAAEVTDRPPAAPDGPAGSAQGPRAAAGDQAKDPKLGVFTQPPANRSHSPQDKPTPQNHPHTPPKPQKLRAAHKAKRSAAVQAILDQRELDRIERRLKSIAESVEGHQDLPPAAKSERKALRDRAAALKSALGWSV